MAMFLSKGLRASCHEMPRLRELPHLYHAVAFALIVGGIAV
jgi:hypothetical protein